MYFCEHCQTRFDEPDIVWVGDEEEYAEACPCCGDTHFTDLSDDSY